MYVFGPSAISPQNRILQEENVKELEKFEAVIVATKESCNLNMKVVFRRKWIANLRAS
jgi:hypothetical protein